MRAVDVTGAEVAVVHADDPALAVLAGFDVVVNNADRKGSHVLPTPDGRILGRRPRAVLPPGRQAAHHPVGLGRQTPAGGRAGRVGRLTAIWTATLGRTSSTS